MAEFERNSIIQRWRLAFQWREQIWIFLLLVGCFAGLAGYLTYRSTLAQRLIDIDQAELKTAEFQVDINQTDWGEIVALPGVGEKLARAIVQHRDEFGPFKTHEEIQQVSGIGDGKFDQMKDFLAPIALDESSNMPSRISVTQ